MSKQMTVESESFDRLAKYAIQDINADDLQSPALKRLIEDIRSDTPALSVYNRMHNRHNRGR